VKINKLSQIILVSTTLLLLGTPQSVTSQQAYFIDGYHGGVYGHYPDLYTKFVVDQMQKNPDWKINLEIEPETWDVVRIHDPKSYNVFRDIVADQSDAGRIEYVNPAYAQSYFYNTSGESMIRQFTLGMDKLHEHFPSMTFTTYSAEEPCFSSALPTVLTSLGFKYASTKNPNTCWGGYVSAYGKELVNWIGPDGTPILTSPRHACEELEQNSTWQTKSWGLSNDYVQACLKSGIKHPVGMCFQDAGWEHGPWLKTVKDHYNPAKYVIWKDYFANISDGKTSDDWHFTQEDVKAGLVWGAQVLQRLAQNVRVSENKLLVAEKMASLSYIYSGLSWPADDLKEGWRDLLLSQHHDCWIVPYNGKKGDTWADKVAAWTSITNRYCDAISDKTMKLTAHSTVTGNYTIRVFNTLSTSDKAFAEVSVPGNLNIAKTILVNEANQPVSFQLSSDGTKLIFIAQAPSVGYTTYRLISGNSKVVSGTKVTQLKNGNYQLESNLYKMIVDPSKGGAIKSLVAKTLNNKEYVDSKNEMSFNDIRGHFINKDRFCSASENKATVRIVENGPVRVSIEVSGIIEEQPFKQVITLTQDVPAIGFELTIDWKTKPSIGKFISEKFKAEDPIKSFYNDKYKLQVVFPSMIKSGKLYKNAPFDVCESKLEDTFYDSWKDIKHNVIVNWVDVTDQNEKFGMAMLSDHTTSYVYGKDYPLGLTLQFTGQALWGRNYTVEGPTHVRYALMPHAGKWDKGTVSEVSSRWNEPLLAIGGYEKAVSTNRSLISLKNSGYEVVTVYVKGSDMYIRLFNASGDETPNEVTIGCKSDKIELVELNDKIITTFGQTEKLTLKMPRFGIRTLKLINARL